MSFKLLIRDPDGGPHMVLHEIDDRRVTRVGLVTRNGEAGAARIDADMTEVLIEFEVAKQDGRPTLQDVEAQQGRTLTGDEAQERIDELATLSSASNSGIDYMLDASQPVEEEPPVVEEPSDTVDEESSSQEPSAPAFSPGFQS